MIKLFLNEVAHQTPHPSLPALEPLAATHCDPLVRKFSGQSQQVQ